MMDHNKPRTAQSALQPGEAANDAEGRRAELSRQALSIGIELGKNAVRARTLDDLQFIMVNDTRALLSFDRSLLILHLGERSELAATNNQPRLEKKSEFVKKVNSLSPELRTLDKALVLVAADLRMDDVPETTAEHLRQYLLYSKCSSLMIIPLAAYERVIGHLVFEYFGDNAPGQINTLAMMNMTPFFASALFEKWNLAKSRKVRRSFFKALEGHDPEKEKSAAARKIGLVAALMVTIVIALALPVDLRVGGEAEVAPEYEYFAFVEMDGIVDEVFTREGEWVEEGRVLAKLDVKEIDYKIREAERLRESYQAEMEILRNVSAEDPAKLAEGRLVAIKSRRAAQKIGFLKWQRRFLQIRAPTDGIVLTEKVESLIGKKFKAGEPFCTIARADALLLDILIRESDVAFVRPGQRAEVFFNYRPDEGHRLTVKSIAPRAEAASRLGNAFKVKAVFAEQPPRIKPGMQGIAQISTRRASLWFVLTRRLRAKIKEISLYF